ncbi:hypothetical protein D9M68_745340 [compost metagenome]
MVSIPLPAPYSAIATKASHDSTGNRKPIPTRQKSTPSLVDQVGCKFRPMENSASLPTTCEGPMTIPMASAVAVANPSCFSTSSKWTEIEEVTRDWSVSSAATSRKVERMLAGKESVSFPFVIREVATAASVTRGISSKWIGNPIARCAVARTKQAYRHPSSCSRAASNGQPKVLAKPPSRVSPLIDARADSPSSRPNVAKAAS